MNIFFPLLLSVFFLFSTASCDSARTFFRLLKAETAYNQGKFDVAIRIYREILRKYPLKGELHWKLGIAYYSKGDIEGVKEQEARLRKLKEEALADDLERLLERR